MRRMLAIPGALGALAFPALAIAQPAPTRTAAAETYAPFAPKVGKTWRGTGTGAEAFEDIQSSTGVLGEDGVYRVRSSVEKDGAWAEVGGFDYREDPSARVVMPVPTQAGGEAATSLGSLELSRRIVRGVDDAGQDVAGYLRVANRGGEADRLTGASCACAERIELHRIDRSGPSPDMVSDEGWDAPVGQPLDVRPGSNLHLMLIGYDPAKAVDGKVRLTLTFRDAGPVEADFALVEDSRAAWDAFD